MPQGESGFKPGEGIRDTTQILVFATLPGLEGRPSRKREGEVTGMRYIKTRASGSYFLNAFIALDKLRTLEAVSNPGG